VLGGRQVRRDRPHTRAVLGGAFAGILLGLPRAVAHELIVQTLVGAAIMLAASNEHPVLLREAVTSPGGTTIAAIRTMEDHGVRAAMLSAIEAARDCSRELAGD